MAWFSDAGCAVGTRGRFVAVDDLVIGLATDQDEPEIRRLLRDNPMAGELRVCLEREPDARMGFAVGGDRHLTVVARRQGGGLAGMGHRTVLDAYVNGEPRRVGYLGQLRIDPACRGRRRLLVESYAMIRSLREPGETPFDMTTIIADNQPARRLLERGLKGLPMYRPLDRFTTFIIPTRATRDGSTPPGVRIEQGAVDRIEEIAACLERSGRRHQLAARWTPGAILDGERCRGLAPEHFLLAVKRGAVVGCLAVWDQSAFKQIIVRGYGALLRRWRPWLNLVAPLAGIPRLPDAGQPVAHAYLSHVAVDDDSAEVFLLLLQSAINRAFALRLECLIAGFAHRHAFAKLVTRGCRAWEYASVVYAVHWDEGSHDVGLLDDRALHLDVALL